MKRIAGERIRIPTIITPGSPDNNMISPIKASITPITGLRMISTRTEVTCCKGTSYLEPPLNQPFFLKYTTRLLVTVPNWLLRYVSSVRSSTM